MSNSSISKICSIDGCNNKSVGRGWCHKHYKRWQIHGDPEIITRVPSAMPLDGRFHMQYEIITESGCWVWIGHVGQTGYGQIKDNYKTRSAHRVSYELHHGRIPEGLYVCHTCDIKCCVNPSHLYAGTAKDNRADAVNRGRLNPITGINHHNAKLSDIQVMRIFNSKEDKKVLAMTNGVSVSTINDIQSGRRRRLVTNARRMGNIT